MSLSGRTALVTGASRGLGKAIALRLARDGAAIAVNYREQSDAAEAVTAQIRAQGGRALAVQADVADEAQVRDMVARVVRELGDVDVLVNNAGVSYTGDLGSFDVDRMESMRRVNVDAVIALTRAVAETMKARRFGRIVNLSSVAGLGTAVAGTTFYAVTKAAVIMLTRRFALELGPHGVTVNAVAPGFVLTDMARAGRTEADFAALAAATMVRRNGDPEDIAHAVSFLASPEAGFVTAQILTVDGGRMNYIGHP
ncbi:MAG TPA: 3-oxoacyl-ACP reductase family protein [Methylomirabilota bacterium]|jgi:3-oxoacyl-[acyl-carrier protein] reductase|nr:3-oxoacyl-ACP reductase family protein [Methylomirabilota bacterium]